MDRDNSQRKIIKVIAGVVLNKKNEMDDSTSKAERAENIDIAIRFGYLYGLTYPFLKIAMCFLIPRK